MGVSVSDGFELIRIAVWILELVFTTSEEIVKGKSLPFVEGLGLVEFSLANLKGTMSGATVWKLVVVGNVLGKGGRKAVEIVAALSIALGSLKVRKSDEDHKEDQASDSQNKHDLDDREALLRIDIQIFHIFLSFLATPGIRLCLI